MLRQKICIFSGTGRSDLESCRPWWRAVKISGSLSLPGPRFPDGRVGSSGLCCAGSSSGSVVARGVALGNHHDSGLIWPAPLLVALSTSSSLVPGLLCKLAYTRPVLSSASNRMGVLLSTIYFSAVNSVFSTLHAEPGLRFYDDDKNALLEVRVPNESVPERMAMREFIASKCPSLTQKFTPAWWLFKYAHPLLVLRKRFLMDPVVISRRSTVWQVTFRRLIRLCTTGACLLVHLTHQFEHSLFSRKYLQLKDGGTMSVTFALSQRRSITFYLSGLDFVPSTTDHRSFKEDAPVIVVMHGLTGGQYRLV
jgi:hypothetical protein